MPLSTLTRAFSVILRSSQWFVWSSSPHSPRSRWPCTPRPCPRGTETRGTRPQSWSRSQTRHSRPGSRASTILFYVCSKNSFFNLLILNIAIYCTDTKCFKKFELCVYLPSQRKLVGIHFSSSLLKSLIVRIWFLFSFLHWNSDVLQAGRFHPSSALDRELEEVFTPS